jgi:transcriptional regulator with XRE-family HTH domain
LFDAKGFYAEIGTLIGLARRKRAMNQEQLAAKSGIGRPRLASIETGRQKVSVDALWRIAWALEVDLQELVPAPERNTAKGPSPVWFDTAPVAAKGIGVPELVGATDVRDVPGSVAMPMPSSGGSVD